MAELDSKDYLKLAIKILIGSVPHLGHVVNTAIFDSMSELQLKEMKSLIEACVDRIGTLEKNQGYWSIRDELNLLFKSVTATSIEGWCAEFAVSPQLNVLRILEKNFDTVMATEGADKVIHDGGFSNSWTPGYKDDHPPIAAMNIVSKFPPEEEQVASYLRRTGVVLMFNGQTDRRRIMINPAYIEFVRHHIV